MPEARSKAELPDTTVLLLKQDLIPCSERLPEARPGSGLTSKGVLFLVDDQLHAGHYHTNGWFYEAADSADDRRGIMAWASGLTPFYPSETSKRVSEYPQATHWCYLRSE